MRVGRVASTSAALVFASALHAGAAQFVALVDLAGGGITSSARGISADGSTVVGSSSSTSGTEAFRWTDATGIEGLGDLSGGTFRSEAYAVSEDGAVIVGESIAAGGIVAFRWTEAGMQSLGDLPGATTTSAAHAVAADGSVVAGVGAASAGTEAFRWTASTQSMVGLGDLPGGGFYSNAWGISADGGVIVGRSNSTASGSVGEAFLWSQATGPVALGATQANAVSADGLVVVGYGVTTNGREAFRWSAAGGMEDLGFLSGGDWSEAAAVSADGSVVVGRSDSASGPTEAFLWDAQLGLRALDDELAALGVDVTGWTLFEAMGISADGLSIAGTGTNPQGRREAWIARLPEPAGALPLAAALLALGLVADRRARRHGN